MAEKLKQREMELMDKEKRLTSELHACEEAQGRIRKMAKQLADKDEELNRQRQELQKRFDECDECEQQLSIWQNELDHTSEMLKQRETESTAAPGKVPSPNGTKLTVEVNNHEE
mmetsp:Transcript_19347/g.26842  ORF Transcript_19347/g.26842 Transcript_19347/m.26842 type:complete len:114 (+) Transcript_19347:328-669(+)